MKKISLITAILFIISPLVFSGEVNHLACGKIAKACNTNGFNNKNKKFWQDCMKPLILGKKVDNITIAAGEVTACRQSKIIELQQELHELQNVK